MEPTLERSPTLPRALGLTDLVLLKLAVIVNVNTVPAVAVYGRAALVLWVLAWAAFFVPSAVAVLVFAARYPGEGGIYLWIRRQFGELHGFLAGWCYCTTNLFYIPMQLVYLTGLLAFVGGPATVSLVDNRAIVATVAFGWLALVTLANLRGLGTGKWIQNLGGVSTAVTIGLLGAGALIGRHVGTAPGAQWLVGSPFELLSAFSVMCFSFIGIELASTMGDEMREPGRNLPRAVITAGVLALAAYLAVTVALLALVPAGELRVIQGIMQAVGSGADRAGILWIVAPVALAMAVSIGGGASAWFAGVARIPFVAGLDRALPPALGRSHPRWHSPYVALIVEAVLCAVFVGFSLVGSTVAEAYQVLLKASVAINLVPFIYLFAGLMNIEGASRTSRLAGAVGLVTSAAGLLAAFIPPGDVQSRLMFEAKMLVGCVVPTIAGLLLFVRSRQGPNVSLGAGAGKP